MNLEDIAREVRAHLLEISHRHDCPHLGSSLSCVELLVAAYWNDKLNLSPETWSSPLRDRLVFSKGHGATTLYSILALRGYIPLQELETFGQRGSRLAEHPKPFAIPGLELATGSLGHGLSVGVGLAKAAQIKRNGPAPAPKVCVVMSDGECNEGSVWEAALVAPANRLDNLIVMIDYNKWQATGRSNEVTALSPLVDKWTSFGWEAVETDGHDISKLSNILSSYPLKAGRPTAVIAHTVKGKGVSFMEDDNNWHYRIPNAEELKKAYAELGIKR